MPDETPGVDGGVVLLSAEDDPSATIAPRLRAAGADLARMDVRGADEWDAATGQQFSGLFLVPRDIPLLEEIIQRRAARLVVIDPLMAYLDGKVNSWRNHQDVRAALAPLAALAEHTGAAILILRHLNKAAGGNALYRGRWFHRDYWRGAFRVVGGQVTGGS